MQAAWIRPATFYVMLVFVGLAGACGDAALNHWAKSNRLYWLWLSYVIWIGLATLFGLVLRWQRYSFSGAVAIALLVHTATAAVIDRTYLGRHFSLWEWVGLVCAGLAIAAFEFGTGSAAVAE